MSTILQVRSILESSVTLPKERAAAFFKTGAGQYAEEDQFIGVTVPNLRKIAKQFYSLSLPEIKEFLHSKINEERLLALFILVHIYQKGGTAQKEELYQFYLDNLPHINNWNLVDSSAHLIIGAHLWDKERASLLTLAVSPLLWERRIAIVSTWFFIRKGDLEWTFRLAALLLYDKEDLIHKAVGWMLRESGKKNEAALVIFLDKYGPTMPRTMLRYSIEKFSEEKRKKYLAKRVI